MQLVLAVANPPPIFHHWLHTIEQEAAILHIDLVKVDCAKKFWKNYSDILPASNHDPTWIFLSTSDALDSQFIDLLRWGMTKNYFFVLWEKNVHFLHFFAANSQRGSQGQVGDEIAQNIRAMDAAKLLGKEGFSLDTDLLFRQPEKNLLPIRHIVQWNEPELVVQKSLVSLSEKILGGFRLAFCQNFFRHSKYFPLSQQQKIWEFSFAISADKNFSADVATQATKFFEHLWLLAGGKSEQVAEKLPIAATTWFNAWEPVWQSIDEQEKPKLVDILRFPHWKKLLQPIKNESSVDWTLDQSLKDLWKKFWQLYRQQQKNEIWNKNLFRYWLKLQSQQQILQNLLQKAHSLQQFTDELQVSKNQLFLSYEASLAQDFSLVAGRRCQVLWLDLGSLERIEGLEQASLEKYTLFAEKGSVWIDPNSAAKLARWLLTMEVEIQKNLQHHRMVKGDEEMQNALTQLQQVVSPYIQELAKIGWHETHGAWYQTWLHWIQQQKNRPFVALLGFNQAAFHDYVSKKTDVLFTQDTKKQDNADIVCLSKDDSFLFFIENLLQRAGFTKKLRGIKVATFTQMLFLIKQQPGFLHIPVAEVLSVFSSFALIDRRLPLVVLLTGPISLQPLLFLEQQKICWQYIPADGQGVLQTWQFFHQYSVP